MNFPLDGNCFVTSITLAAVAKFGLSALDMDPLMLRDACEEVFGLGKMPQRMFDKLNCGVMLLGTDLFTASIEGFLTGTAIMNGLVFDSTTIPYCTLEQCAWGVWEYINLNGDIDENKSPTETFCPDVAAYIRAAGRANGVSKMPIWLKFAEDGNGPDTSDDVDLAVMYMDRQSDYISDLNGYVTERQARLADELKRLKADGYIAKS